jgi:hypothetical protein
VREREPIRRALSGLIERQEFEHLRRGTVNVLNFLVVHSGRMETAVVERKDAAHYVRELRALRRRHRRLRGVFLVHDGDPGHTAADTEAYLDECGGWWRPRLTPAHASWLNQAELLNRAFAPRAICGAGRGRRARRSSTTSWRRHRSTTGSTPTRSSGRRPIRRCGTGSPNIATKFVALLLSKTLERYLREHESDFVIVTADGADNADCGIA